MGRKSSMDHPVLLFQGKQFWLSHNIPQRSRFKDLIQQYGGVVRLHEKDADIKLVDHARKNLPPGTYSYRYVEWSVRNGKLEELEDHRAGPSAARPVGATNIPTRSCPTPYTLEDDQWLWDQMAPYEKDPKAFVGGNKIYQELATQNPRHTYQSYRDRYLRRLRGRPRPGGMPKPNPPTSTEKDDHQKVTQREQSQDDNLVIHELGDKKRKRPPEHNSDLELNGAHLASQKRRAIDKTPKDLIPMIHAHQNKSPHIERTPTPATSVDNEAHITHSPATNISEPAQPQETESPDHDPETAIDPLFLELPFLPSSPDPEPEEPPEQDIDTWIDHRLQTGRAENEEQIIEALRCTSMDPYLADKVLDYLTAGKGIPNNMPGVWTAEDDRCFEAKETRTIEQVLKKHGSDAFNSRWEYFGMARAAGLDETDS
ncbi:TRF2-interacting telomeric protein/Rap1 C terminal domain-containing protein [Aspergillus caelatus]|uniref:DNA-binding protein RAP1 n=1 Tax=Aspergillus caelatus TaxID=61420 RepID=A0A5N6ZTC9_9EURO|nr:TRF2-interacting telomeric protein/Rap1 C terminal domain-containing protein [Aspergillus caelatus]KAE8360655.1 TRF2-interacting telomeric protein/Rap1 C terminal domain-containing protein [Aspergillus caelatus]